MIVRRVAGALLLMLLASAPAFAQMQSDCRRAGTVGTAVMGADGTITLNLRSADGSEGLLVYKKGDPQYARILSHLGGMRPGEHKPVPAFC